MRLWKKRNVSYGKGKGIGGKSYKNRKSVRTGVGITIQHDRRSVYRRKRMPRRKRRQWRRFVKKVNAVDERELGTQTVVFNTAISVETTNPQNQLLENVGLYTNASSLTYCNDMKAIYALFNTGNPTAATDDYVNATTKVMFHSGVLDMTARNTSKDNVGASLDIPLEVDVYDITVGKGDNDTVLTAPTELISYFDQASTDTLGIGGNTGTADLAIIKRGVTPFDIPDALSRYRMKILKKTKYFLGIGQTFTYQIRDPKRHVTSVGAMARGDVPNINGLTRWVLMIAKPVPGITVSSTVIPRLEVGVTRKYMFKVEGLRTTRDYWLKN